MGLSLHLYIGPDGIIFRIFSIGSSRKLYLKRFAQSAGPGHVVLCLRKRLPKSEKYRAERSPIFWPLVFYYLGSTLIHCTILEPLLPLLPPFWSVFCHIRVILGAIGMPLGSFGGSKNGLGSKSAPRAAQEAPPPKSPHPFGDLLELFFRTFSIFLLKKRF